MSLNIKSEHTCALASELAALTGQTLTAAITEALEQQLQRVKNSRDVAAKSAELMAIGRRCASRLKSGPSSTEIGDFLYDEKGLPG